MVEDFGNESISGSCSVHLTTDSQILDVLLLKIHAQDKEDTVLTRPCQLRESLSILFLPLLFP